MNANGFKQLTTEEKLAYFDKVFNITLDITRANVFEYDPNTKQIRLHGNLAVKYQLPDVIRAGPHAFIETGIIDKADSSIFLSIFERIENGEPLVEQNLTGIIDGKSTAINIYLVNIFDIHGMPIYSIGTLTDENGWFWALRENEYARSLIIDRELICEANITADKIIHAKNILDITFECGSSFKNFALELAKNTSAPEHTKTVSDNLERLNIEKLYNSDIRRFSFRFKGCTDKSCAHTQWLESTVQIFKDFKNSDLYIQIYNRDVSELVLLSDEAQYVHEQYKNAKNNPSVVAHEINFTKDKFTNIDENWFLTHDISPSGSYSEMLLEFTKKHILPEDMVAFLDIFNQKNILFDFSHRKHSHSCNFRQYFPGGKYRWQNCKIFTYLDQQSFEVRGFISFEDKHYDLEAEIIFKYGDERDLLTGLYKKEIFQREVNNFLYEIKNKGKLHGIILLDLDDFERVNSTFGRDYGDNVLASVSDIIKKSFRHSDIIGRLSGDTFCILTKDIISRDRLLSKADEICKKLNLIYTEGMQTVAISASVGIAFSDDKSDCEKLLEMARDAMYTVKKAGKNSYSVYLS